jgi:hypothetical protein
MKTMDAVRGSSAEVRLGRFKVQSSKFKARNQAQSSNAVGSIVAGLSFGFWTLFELWYLSSGFPIRGGHVMKGRYA